MTTEPTTPAPEGASASVPSAAAWPYLLSAGMAGAALGLMAYRFGVLPLAWSSSKSFVFPGLAAGLGVGAVNVIKGRDGKRPAAIARLGVAVLGCAAAFGIAFAIVPPLGRASLSARALPGFSIDLPDGTVAADVADYQTGKLTLSNVAGSGSVIAVQWERGAVAREDLQLAANALAPTLGGGLTKNRMVQLAGPGGAMVDTVELDSDKGTLRMSMLPCGSRRVLIATIGASGMATLHARVLPTLACHPDPKLESTALGEVPLVVELPGWGAAERLAGQLSLTDGRSYMMLKAGISSNGTLDQVIGPVFNALGAKLVVTRDGADGARLTGELEGDHVEGWARLYRCGQRTTIAILMSPDRTTADEVATLATSARCPRPGEAPQVWPDAPSAPSAPATPPAPGAAAGSATTP